MATKNKILSINELRRLMSLQVNSDNTTNGWDVLVSYSLDALNACLHKEYSKTPLNDVVVSYSEEDDDEKDTRTFYLNLPEPKMEFTDDASGCRLKLPIGPGSQYDKGEGRKDLPQGYSILVDVTLEAGKKNNGVFTIHSYGQGDGSTVKLDGSEEVHIAVYFDIAKSQFSFDPKPESKFTKTFRFLREGLRSGEVTQKGQKLTHFDYSVMQVVPTSEKGLILTPKSFIYTPVSYGESNGVLSVWIETEQYGKTQRREHPIFSLASNEVCPIPEKHSASIIFSHDLMLDKYFKPALGVDFKVSPTYQDLDGNNLVGGFNFLLVYNDEKKRLIRKDYKTNERYGFVSKEGKLNDLVIDFEKNPLLLSTREDGFYLSWKWYQEFTYEITEVDIVMGTPLEYHHEGKASISATMDKKCEISRFEDSRFAFRIDLGSDSVKLEYKKIKGIDMFTLFGEKESEIAMPNWFRQDLENTIKNSQHVNIDFGDIDYFSEANILFNEKRFRRDNSLGLQTPRELMVVGDIS